MANTKSLSLLLLALIAFSMLATEVLSHKHDNSHFHGNYGPGTVKPSQCSSRCNDRCSDTGYRNACILFCNKCCRKCQCVPPGTYGNKQVCPCYNNWKTQQGGPKCP